MRTIKTLERRLELAERQAELAYVDALTELPNKRAYTHAIDRELGKAYRHRRSLTLVVVDIDHFKRVNDTYGHPVGDQVIKSVGSILAKGLRSVDFVGRLGGEEFVLILPELGHEHVARRVESLRAAIEGMVVLSVPLAHGHVDVRVTASFGCAVRREDDTAETLYSVADKALYAAKKSGRNQVVVAT